MAGVAGAIPTFPLPHQHFVLWQLLAAPIAHQIRLRPHQLWKQSSTHERAHREAPEGAMGPQRVQLYPVHSPGYGPATGANFIGMKNSGH